MKRPILLVRVPSAVCALPLSEVIETMRPLPISPLTEVPDFVRGVALIRGIPTPVIELGAMFNDDQSPPAGRFVTIRNSGRTIALAVQSVIGVAELDPSGATPLPPLLKNARTDVIEAIARLDAELLVVLQTASLVPDSVWKSLGIFEAAL
jgi:purine-binding chemotaxis protein CheW